MVMSLHESFVIGCMLMILTSLVWKWNKALLVIILMESITALIMSLLLINSSSYYFFLILMFIFFVSEALILLSSLYSSLRYSGVIHSSMIFI